MRGFEATPFHDSKIQGSGSGNKSVTRLFLKPLIATAPTFPSFLIGLEGGFQTDP